VPELSRRGRGITVYATLRALGRRGIRELVMTSCALARRMADHLRGEPGVTVLNHVVLNQVLVRVGDRNGANVTPEVIAIVQREGVCWLGGTQWAGAPAMRISISGWSTSNDDVDRSADSIVRAIRGVRAEAR
jgi:glutamate/tyrosine decarboxylase-like PLP-dependent enzyme